MQTKNLHKRFSIQSHYSVIVLMILLTGFIVRLFAISTTPLGLNQDEAYAGYEAYSLLNYHMDSHGYTNPVYFNSWGSGMNVLYSYLTIPFIFLSGNKLTPFVIRLPQAVFACLCLVAFYFIMCELFSNKCHICLGTFIFAIMPWHIMLAHWGLESNIAPAFLTFGLLFMLKAINNSKYYMACAFFYGLSLYAYAPLWIFVPLILLLSFFYLIYCKKFKPDKFIFISIIILFVLALPLMLFLLVNNGFIPEIKTGLFSIPKLLEYRGGELSLKNIKYSVFNFYDMFSGQNDDLIWNCIPQFGLYYKLSTPFLVIGLCTIFSDTIKSIKAKAFTPTALIAFNIVVGVLFALLIGNININKVNILHIPFIIAIVYGIITVLSWLGQKLIPYVVLPYLIVFLAFTSYYFNLYNYQIQKDFQDGVIDALWFSETLNSDIVYIDSDISYSKVLFATKYPADDYSANAVFDPSLPNDYQPVSFGKYNMKADYENLQNNAVYIIPADYAYIFSDAGFTVRNFNLYCTAYME